MKLLQKIRFFINREYKEIDSISVQSDVLRTDPPQYILQITYTDASAKKELATVNKIKKYYLKYLNDSDSCRVATGNLL